MCPTLPRTAIELYPHANCGWQFGDRKQPDVTCDDGRVKVVDDWSIRVFVALYHLQINSSWHFSWWENWFNSPNIKLFLWIIPLRKIKILNNNKDIGLCPSIRLRQKHDPVSKLCPQSELEAIRSANRKLVAKCHFLLLIVNNRSGLKWKTDRLFSLSCPLPSLSSNISALSYHCIFPLIYSLPGSFPSSPPHGGLRATAANYLGRSPHFPDGFSKTSTTVHPGCSWGGMPWQILSQSSGRIVPESRPQSRRSACPGPPEHNKPRTTVFIQITTKLLFFSEHTKQQ